MNAILLSEVVQSSSDNDEIQTLTDDFDDEPTDNIQRKWTLKMYAKNEHYKHT
jgi:hypothetical protein